MGSGTEVAKNASDILILDDSFVTVTNSIIYGKNIYDSVYKFIHFMLTVNFVTMLFIFLGAVIFD